MREARDELLFVMFVCKPSMRKAAELLLVVSAAARDTTLAAKDEDVFVNEVLRVVTLEASDEEVLDKLVSVVDKRLDRDELLFVIFVSAVETRPDREDDRVVCVPCVMVKLAAIDELLLVIVLCRPSMRVAAELLFVAIVPLMLVIDEFMDATEPLNDPDVEANDELRLRMSVAAEELTVVTVP